MGRNKKVTCGKCFRVMRSDHLNRHLEQHEKDNYKNEMFCSTSITSSKQSLREETESEFSSVSTTKSTPINEEFVIKSMVIDSKQQI